MDELKPLEEIRNWDHPPRYGIDQFKEKAALIFLENQKDLFHHHTTRFQMPVKQVCQDISYTAITLNPESNFTRREKNQSPFHWNILTYPELLIRIWMSNKNAASMIIGTLMALETCLILGQVSHNLLYWTKILQTDTCGLEGDWGENSLHPGKIVDGQNSGRNWEERPSWRRGRSGRVYFGSQWIYKTAFWENLYQIIMKTILQERGAI